MVRVGLARLVLAEAILVMEAATAALAVWAATARMQRVAVAQVVTQALAALAVLVQAAALRVQAARLAAVAVGQALTLARLAAAGSAFWAKGAAVLVAQT